MEERDALNRRTRLLPHSTGKRLRLTECDVRLLQKLLQHGPLSSSFLIAYASGLRANRKRCLERLTDLFHETRTVDGGSYLMRPPQQFRTLDSRYNQLVYDLAPAGRKALARLLGKENASPSRSGPWLHSFMVSSITASIELATLKRPDLRFIPESEILSRAKTDLRYPVSIGSVRTGLIPDALFGLEYDTERGKRFRFFVVEADRATEPLSAGNFNRKSFAKSLLQYEAYVGEGGYREHLKLSSPLLVLWVTSCAKRADKMKTLAERHYPEGNSYLLFQSWEDFSPVFRPPHPNDALLSSPWERAGMDGFRIDQA